MPGFPERILVIDDDAATLQLISLALQKAGDVDVRLCESADAALAIMPSFVPDLILLDLIMPEKDGTHMLAALRDNEELKGIPVIIITMEDRVHMMEAYKKLGVLGILHKPFDSGGLLTDVQRLWQLYRFAPDKHA